MQRRTMTPFTNTIRQAATGRRTATAPCRPAQPARTTPRGAHHRIAVVGFEGHGRSEGQERGCDEQNERMLLSLIVFIDRQARNVLRIISTKAGPARAGCGDASPAANALRAPAGCWCDLLRGELAEHVLARR
jgi:hypothetical protein